MSKLVAFTGHRPDKLGGYGPQGEPIREAISAWLFDRMLVLKGLNPDLQAISGMALGFDLMAFSVCALLGIPVHAYVPFVGQELKWPQQSQNMYRGLLTRAASVYHVNQSRGADMTMAQIIAAMQARNEAMVDHSDLLIACWNGSRGGTGNCVSYAIKQQREIEYVPIGLLP